jgi:hypothetical protein
MLKGRVLPGSSQPLVGSVVLAVTEEESTRFVEVAKGLKVALGSAVAVVLLEPDLGLAAERERDWGMRVAAGPRARARRSMQQFSHALKRTRTLRAEDVLGSAFDGCEFHFAYYATRRWPNLIDLSASWRRLWASRAPKVVIISTLEDARSQLPARSAAALGIPTVAIPHGASDVKYRGETSAGTVLHVNRLQGDAYRASGVPDHKLRGCRGIVMAHEYPLNSHVQVDPGTTRIVVLVDAVSYAAPGRVLMDSLVMHGDQITALRSVAQKPDDLDVQVLVKTHPAFPDFEIIRAAAPGLEDRLLPLDSDLVSLLSATDLVVAVNYVGSALFEVARARRPTILFWNSPMFWRRNANPYVQLVKDLGVVVTDPQDLWPTVRGFVNDLDVRSSLQRRADEFHRLVEEDGYPTLPEVLARLSLT